MSSLSLAAVRMPPHPDADAAEAAVAALLEAVGLDPGQQRLAGTPRRVAETLIELLRPTELSVSTMPAEGFGELVLMRGIPFQSLCEHHLLPFRGTATIGYLPGARIAGISALPRIVEHYARGLQLQERFTAQIADRLEHELAPRGVGVLIEAEQLCMSMRGVGTPATTTVTCAYRGELASAGPWREQFDRG